MSLEVNLMRWRTVLWRLVLMPSWVGKKPLRWVYRFAPRGDVFMCRSTHRDGSHTYIRFARDHITLEDIEEFFDSLLILKIIGMQHFWHLDGLWHHNQRVEQASTNNMTWLSCINGYCWYVHDRRTKLKPKQWGHCIQMCSIVYFTSNC